MDSWTAQAKCRGLPNWFFFWSGTSAWRLLRARKYCRNCPVRLQCLESSWLEKDGIKGGLSPLERSSLTFAPTLVQLDDLLDSLLPRALRVNGTPTSIGHKPISLRLELCSPLPAQVPLRLHLSLEIRS